MYAGEKRLPICSSPSYYREDQDMKWISSNGNGHKVTMCESDYKAF